MLYLLDTSVCVSLIRGQSPPSALPQRDECIVSAITAAELEVGVHRSSKPNQQRLAVDALLSCFPVLPLTSTVATDYGRIRVELERKGLGIGPLDFLIAAHALSLGAAIVTGNVGEFERVEGLKLRRWR